MKFLLQGLTVGLFVAIYLSFKQSKDAKKQGNDDAARKHKTIGIVCCIAVVIVFSLSIVNALNAPNKSKAADAWQTKDNSTMAYIMMQDFVKRRLKSPASAKFPFASEQDISIQKDEHEYVIFAYVDSQNSFGAMIRTYYSGVVKQIDAENWQLVTLDIGE